jgi:hypothetical protein
VVFQSPIVQKRWRVTRFERTVYGTDFGSRPLGKLWMADIKKWRHGTGLSKSSQNRTMSTLRAALNLAVQNRRVGADRAIEWKLVRQHSHVEGRRRLFLDLEQRRRLIDAAGGAIGDLMHYGHLVMREARERLDQVSLL